LQIDTNLGLIAVYHYEQY